MARSDAPPKCSKCERRTNHKSGICTQCRFNTQCVQCKRMFENNTKKYERRNLCNPCYQASKGWAPRRAAV